VLHKFVSFWGKTRRSRKSAATVSFALRQLVSCAQTRLRQRHEVAGIMSYAESCNGCVRIPSWSNPRVLYKGEPTATLMEDNARVILEQAERVSKFR
jgi:hypothetical protein